MTHYQKIATMIFRIAGILAITASLIMWVPAVLMSWLLPQTPLVFFSFLPHLIYLFVGMILFASSRTLAKWVCLDFDKFNDR